METRQWMTIPVDEFEALHEQIKRQEEIVRETMVMLTSLRNIAKIEADEQRLRQFDMFVQALREM